MMLMLAKVNLKKGDKDSWLWEHDKKGVFSVNSFFNNLHDRNQGFRIKHVHGADPDQIRRSEPTQIAHSLIISTHHHHNIVLPRAVAVAASTLALSPPQGSPLFPRCSCLLIVAIVFVIAVAAVFVFAAICAARCRIDPQSDHRIGSED
ncbi:hypothetical protein PIB30_016207 [Stylosanthes scabra]|uniref:Uncharacterized protein n=1 Tax=Stylosanthes scabra TaxID=79078 RepID=A0ABU6V5J4_9FABA|nr:hypothetical protein [Stylosanthes scabra]